MIKKGTTGFCRNGRTGKKNTAYNFIGAMRRRQLYVFFSRNSSNWQGRVIENAHCLCGYHCVGWSVVLLISEWKCVTLFMSWVKALNLPVECWLLFINVGLGGFQFSTLNLVHCFHHPTSFIQLGLLRIINNFTRS